MDYSDSTPDITFTNAATVNFSRRGIPSSVKDSSGMWRLEYDHADRLTAAVCTNGAFNGITISNRFNGLNGRDQLKVLGISPALTHDYRFDTLGRLSVVSNTVYSASYGYLPNSDLLQTTTFTNNGSLKLTTSRRWDFGSRLRDISNLTGSTVVSSHAYAYDSLNRRTRATLEDMSAWDYEYNSRNELVRGSRVWADQSPAAGQQFQYGYDNIGNRTNALAGGDSNGANLRETDYLANALNQYTNVVTPGYKEVAGVTKAINSVWVNGVMTDRKGEYYRREVPVSNGGAPLWQPITVFLVWGSSNAGCVFPKNSQTNSYDLDGNLTFDGIWTYQWDAENRLKTMTMTNVSGIADGERKKLEFAYDYLNRRTSKTVSTWDGSLSAFSGAVTTRFINDGWNVVAEIDGSGNALRSYLWGQDLSGTMDEAGGIGGLVLVVDHVPVTDTYHFTAFDGNGNVMALIDASNQSVSARYEYSPYGELLRLTGPLARVNPVRWSTKFWDEESGLVYYGHRYYSSVLGRWISRDPIEEEDALNLYAAASNDLVNRIDPLGLNTLAEEDAAAAGSSWVGASSARQAMSILNRVRDVVDTYNMIQELGSAIMDAAESGEFEFDPTDALIAVIDAGKSALTEFARNPKQSILAATEHHILTDKNSVSTAGGGPYTPKFKKILARAGLHLNDAFNKVYVVGHRGPHPEYNRLVYRDLLRALNNVDSKNKKKMAAVITKTVIRIGVLSRTPGTKYNKLLTQ